MASTPNVTNTMKVLSLISLNRKQKGLDVILIIAITLTEPDVSPLQVPPI